MQRVERLAVAMWKADRLEMLETALFVRAPDHGLDDKRLDLFQRYALQVEREFTRCRKALAELAADERLVAGDLPDRLLPEEILDLAEEAAAEEAAAAAAEAAAHVAAAAAHAAARAPTEGPGTAIIPDDQALAPTPANDDRAAAPVRPGPPSAAPVSAEGPDRANGPGDQALAPAAGPAPAAASPAGDPDPARAASRQATQEARAMLERARARLRRDGLG